MPPRDGGRRGGRDGDAYREALADATAGVIGSLVAMITFYPIDVWKTNVQAKRHHDCPRDDDDDEEEEAGGEVETIERRRNLEIVLRRLRESFRLKSLFRGVHYKALHTTSSSFAYFFLYSWIQNRHRSYHASVRSRCEGEGGGAAAGAGRSYDPSTGTRLLLSGFAAVLNTFCTMPFAVLSARSQTTTTTRRDADDADDGETDELAGEEEVEGRRRRKRMDEVWDEIARAVPPKDDSGSSRGRTTRGGSSSARVSGGGEDGYETPEEYPPAIDNDVAGSGRDDDDDEGEEKKADSNIAGFECHPSRLRAIHKGKRSSVEQRWDYTPQEKGNLIKRVLSKPYLPLRYRAVEQLNDDRPETLAERDERRRKERSRDWTVYWSGLWPSLLLCSNPSIHYTVFDVVKASVLKRKASAASSRGGREGEGRLTMGEAFLIGLVAKFVATIATYPLIRAKVLLMLSGHDGRGGEGGGDGESGAPKERPVASKQSSTWDDPRSRSTSQRGGSSSTSSSPRRRTNGAIEMLKLLRDMYQKGGVIRGLYRGCDIQLVHTVLQSALLMMVRERINVSTRRLLLSARKEG